MTKTVRTATGTTAATGERTPRTRRTIARWRDRRAAARGDAGMTTSEYAMGTIAAAGFATVLYKIVTSGSVSGALESVIGKALDAPF
ncbi:DUF4244 domain-containing protein [Streptomyces sp. NPDC047981]|uniref:DUF4244 domain-containing protein n=1 Tax=Streptomyces sp. NPDC047981 TaxID=3154610 RepID=UPI003413B74F